MHKNTGYQEKFDLLSPWLFEIVEAVKKDLKNEHLKIDREFCKKYFLGKTYQHVQVEEMVAAYQKDIAAGNVGLGEFISTRWLLKNTEVYGFFEESLKKINPNFEELDELDETHSKKMMQDAVNQFGAKKVYLFSVLNSVVFPPSVYKALRDLAEKETKETKASSEIKREEESFQMAQKRHARELSAMEDRYEKKLSALQRKYLKDMGALKKQIVSLQKKNESSSS